MRQKHQEGLWKQFAGLPPYSLWFNTSGVQSENSYSNKLPGEADIDAAGPGVTIWESLV